MEEEKSVGLFCGTNRSKGERRGLQVRRAGKPTSMKKGKGVYHSYIKGGDRERTVMEKKWRISEGKNSKERRLFAAAQKKQIFSGIIEERIGLRGGH